MGIENGVFNKQDLARLGVSRAQLRGYVREGLLVRVRRGWYLRAREYDAAAAEAVRNGLRRPRWRQTDSRHLC